MKSSCSISLAIGVFTWFTALRRLTVEHELAEGNPFAGQELAYVRSFDTFYCHEECRVFEV